MRILVCYSSPHGSTRGVAERVATRLSDRGLAVDCMPIHETQSSDVRAHDAVVVGSAIHDQAWLPEAAGFLLTHAAELAARPLWLFSVGMPGALARPLRRFGMREGPKAVAPFAELLPCDTRLFSGVVRQQDFPRLSRVILRLMGGSYGDFRNWPEIDAWAASIAEELLTAPVMQPAAEVVGDQLTPGQ